MPDSVQPERPGLDELDAVRAFLGEPKQVFDPQHQLARAERLGHVVVRPQFEPLDAILLGGAGGEHEDGDVARLGVALEQAANLEPVDSRQHQVENQQAGQILAGHLEGLVAGVRHVHPVGLLLEMVNDQLEDVRFVIDHQDSDVVFSGHELTRSRCPRGGCPWPRAAGPRPRRCFSRGRRFVRGTCR